jgi:hypothetical protein
MSLPTLSKRMKRHLFGLIQRHIPTGWKRWKPALRQVREVGNAGKQFPQM